MVRRRLRAFKAADGRVWVQRGPQFWGTDDGTVIEGPNQLNDGGRTKAEVNWEKFLNGPPQAT